MVGCCGCCGCGCGCCVFLLRFRSCMGHRSPPSPLPCLTSPLPLSLSKSMSYIYIYILIRIWFFSSTFFFFAAALGFAWLGQRQFRAELRNRSWSQRVAVHPYRWSVPESDRHALCRWLRGGGGGSGGEGGFDLDDALERAVGAAAARTEAGGAEAGGAGAGTGGSAGRGIWPDGAEALGVEPSVYHALYPQAYYCVPRSTGAAAAAGAAPPPPPLFVSRVGRMDPAGLACVTTAAGIVRYHWHDMEHRYPAALRTVRDRDRDSDSAPSASPPGGGGGGCCETAVLIDLEGLSAAHASSHVLAVIRSQTELDALCYPQTLRRMAIVNAPPFFWATWAMVRRWIDPRSASRVTVLGGRGTGTAGGGTELLDLVGGDPALLPREYGGTGPSLDSVLEDEMVRQYEEMQARYGDRGGGGGGQCRPPYCPAPLCGPGRRIVAQTVQRVSVRGGGGASLPVRVGMGEAVELSVLTRSAGGGTVRVCGPGEGGGGRRGRGRRPFLPPPPPPPPPPPVSSWPRTGGGDGAPPTRVEVMAPLDRPGIHTVRIDNRPPPGSGGGEWGWEWGRCSPFPRRLVRCRRPNIRGRGSVAPQGEGAGDGDGGERSDPPPWPFGGERRQQPKQRLGGGGRECPMPMWRWQRRRRRRRRAGPGWNTTSAFRRSRPPRSGDGGGAGGPWRQRPTAGTGGDGGQDRGDGRTGPEGAAAAAIASAAFAAASGIEPSGAPPKAREVELDRSDGLEGGKEDAALSRPYSMYALLRSCFY